MKKKNSLKIRSIKNFVYTIHIRAGQTYDMAKFQSSWKRFQIISIQFQLNVPFALVVQHDFKLYRINFGQVFLTCYYYFRSALKSKLLFLQALFVLTTQREKLIQFTTYNDSIHIAQWNHNLRKIYGLNLFLKET